MTVTTARIGGAIGIALSGAIMTYALTASGLTLEQIDSSEGWTNSPTVFLDSFKFTVHFINVFAVLSVFFALIRGREKN
jgi:hypothetical protein